MNSKKQESSKQRSVAYPFIPLATAIDRAQQFWEKERRSDAPVTSAVSHWGYAEKSSGGKQTLAALLQYGLLEDKGALGGRTVRLTEEAVDILLMPKDDARRDALIKKCAKRPKLYAELLGKWPDTLPSDPTIKYYLVREKNFNPNTVEAAISDFRATMAFAGVLKSGDVPLDSLEKNPSGLVQQNFPVNVGDYVQWTSGGVDQLTSPARVHTVSLDGEYVFIEGHLTGLPMGEVTLVAPPVVAQTVKDVPPVQGPVVARMAGTKQDVFSLDEGQVVLQWPTNMSEESFEDFQAWIELQLRKIGRSVR